MKENSMAKLQSSCGWTLVAAGLLLLGAVGAFDWVPLLVAVAIIVGFCVRPDQPYNIVEANRERG
jgi:hypothetical protein